MNLNSDVTAFWSDDDDFRLHEICRQFEDGLNRGQQPMIEDWLAKHQQIDTERLLYELLVTEKQILEAKQLHPVADVYRNRFPKFTKQIDAVFELPQIENYELLRTLGRGGMAVVYLARPHLLKRLEALKVIHAGDFASQQAKERFIQEANAVALLNHSHVIKIYHLGETNGQPFFTMEYLEGGSLGEGLQGGPWPERESAELVKDLAEAMHFVHGQGILHRDLKPANVLLTKDRKPKIADFGLARLFDLQNEKGSANTARKNIEGSVSYMAPEQARGDISALCNATDVYGLGAILYQMLTGRPPFVGERISDVLDQVLNKLPAPPTEIRHDLHRDLGQICLNCLEKEPKHRYSSAAALAEDLDNFLQKIPIKKSPSIENLERDLYLKNIALAEREWAAGSRQRMNSFFGCVSGAAARLGMALFAATAICT